MDVPIAWLNLLHQKTRALVAVLGVSFAIFLIFMQMMFYSSVIGAAVIQYEALDFDILLRSSSYYEFSRPNSFPREYLYHAASLPEVKRVAPFYLCLVRWFNSEDKVEMSVLTMGFFPSDRVFRLPELEPLIPEMVMAEHVLMDRMCLPKVGSHAVGTVTQANGHRVVIGGNYTLGSGLAGDGNIIVNPYNFMRIVDGASLEKPNLGLVRLVDTADAQAVSERLRSTLPPTVQVMTRAEVLQWERDHWVSATAIGWILAFSVFLAFTVGLVVIYQVLASDIARNISEYATLRAIGYSANSVAVVILQQGILMALVAYPVAWAGAVWVAGALEKMTNIPCKVTLAADIVVFLMAMLMCIGSGWASISKIRKMDPAELFV